LNRVEAIVILKPLFDLALAQPPSIPILRELALLSTGTAPAELDAGPLKKGIHRRYLRLCRLQIELGRLDLKKATPGISFEDFIFSKINFFRYREIEEKYFITLFIEGLKDFDEVFYRRKLNIGKKEVQTLIDMNYKKTEGFYKIQRENPMVLSIMRTLETSLDDLPLFAPNEISGELTKLTRLASKSFSSFPAEIQNPYTLFPLLVLSLDNTVIAHEDGMETKLVVSAEGNLEGLFRPDDKPWTRVLIPKNQNAFSPPRAPGRD